MCIRQKIIVIVVWIVLLWVLPIQAQDHPTFPKDLQQLHQNVWTELLKGTVAADRIHALCERLNEKGSWPDIDYASQQRGNWPTVEHLNRLQSMAKAYQTQRSVFFHDPVLNGKIQLALNFWLAHDFQCPNWWYPQIGVPRALAPTLLLMEAALSPHQLTQGIRILDRAKIAMTGQNKVWLSGNVLLKSLLLRDAGTVRTASASIQEEMKVSLSEGIQPDGSFHQHGPQIQFGNYGLAFVDDMIKWIRILRETPFRFDEAKMAVLRTYLLDGQQWITWKGQMDISACGRQLFVGAQREKSRDLANDLHQMEMLDPSYATEYRKADHYDRLIGNKHFWRSDFQIQRTPDYYFSVKMCSERVIGAESCNSENLQGYYLGDGATYLYQSGKEYENIFPYWDWKKIPGTTIQQDDKELPVLTASGYRIATNFVGGVSDGSAGIAVMDYNRDGIAAKKAWFLVNDQIICLGAGITSRSGISVTTTVNQSFLNGGIVVKADSETMFPDESSAVLSPRWILHDRLGYYFPQGAAVKLANTTVTGSWNRVASMYKDEHVQSRLFKLWIEHGANPTDQTYAYCLIPHANETMMRQLEAHPSFRLLKNGGDAQAIVTADGQWGGIIFYRAGKVDMFGGIETDRPCVVMLKKHNGGMTISVSEPTQKLQELHLTLHGTYQPVDVQASSPSTPGTSTVMIPLPQGDAAGKTITVSMIGK